MRIKAFWVATKQLNKGAGKGGDAITAKIAVFAREFGHYFDAQGFFAVTDCYTPHLRYNWETQFGFESL